MATSATPFLWGDSGSTLTPDQVKERRKMAQALLLKKVGESSPIAHPMQGLARVSDSIIAALEANAADRAGAANQAYSAARLKEVLGGGATGGATTADATPATPGAPATPGSPAGPLRSATTVPNAEVFPTSIGHAADPEGVSGDAIRSREAAKSAPAMPANPVLASAIQKHATAAGLDPVDLATAMSYETGGTFDPWKKGPTTKWGEHRGLIQWGEPQRKQYGVGPDTPIEQQVAASVKYLQDRGVKPGHGLLQIYSAINAGGVSESHYGRSDAHAGGAPGTVADKVNNQMAGHRRKAEALLANLAEQPDSRAAGQVASLEPMVPQSAGGAVQGLPLPPTGASAEEMARYQESWKRPAAPVGPGASVSLPPLTPGGTAAPAGSGASFTPPGAPPMPPPRPPELGGVDPRQRWQDGRLSLDGAPPMPPPRPPELGGVDPRERWQDGRITLDRPGSPGAPPAPGGAPAGYGKPAVPGPVAAGPGPVAAPPAAAPPASGADRGRDRVANALMAGRKYLEVMADPRVSDDVKRVAAAQYQSIQDSAKIAQQRADDIAKEQRAIALEQQRHARDRGNVLADRTDERGYQEGRFARQEQPYKDSASSQAQGHLDIARERLNLDRTPTAVRTAEGFAKNPEALATELKLRTAAANNQTVNVGGGSDKQIFDEMQESAKAAKSAVTGLASTAEARRAVEAGGIFGAGANERLGLQKVAVLLGADPSKVVNTETFRSAIAPSIAALMKATVGSQNISNADREFAEKAAGGAITLDGGSIQKLLGIMEKGHRAVLEDHGRKVDAVYPDAEKFKRERALFGVQAPPAAAPKGVDPGLWKHMTPEERELWK